MILLTPSRYLLTPSRYLAFGDLVATTDEQGITRYASPQPAPVQLAPDQVEAMAALEETEP